MPCVHTGITVIAGGINRLMPWYQCDAAKAFITIIGWFARLFQPDKKGFSRELLRSTTAVGCPTSPSPFLSLDQGLYSFLPSQLVNHKLPASSIYYAATPGLRDVNYLLNKRQGHSFRCASAAFAFLHLSGREAIKELHHV